MEERSKLTHSLGNPINTRFFMVVLVVAVLFGAGTGFFLSGSSNGGSVNSPIDLNKEPETAQEDVGANKTFRDFAEGKITKKPAPKSGDNYGEGSHLLVRDGATPVALTSSVIDLNKYENKSVKVYGETQKALKEGWLMDVGKVEEK